jgi:uncharacterized protein YeaO (DUF488 family)
MGKVFTKQMGKLYTSNPQGLKNLMSETEVWQITRSGNILPDAILVRELSPSLELFNTFITEWKDKPPQTWWPYYEKKFLQELKGSEKLNSLRLLYKELSKGKNIVLVCFCADHRYCHRRLVGEFMKIYGVEVEELNPINYEQIAMF